MMGRHLGSYVKSFFLGLSNQLHRPFRGDVTYVYPSTCELTQGDVPGNQSFFGFDGYPAQAQACGDRALVHAAAGHQDRVLAMVHNGKARKQCKAESAAHERRIVNRAAIIAETDDSSLCHLDHFCQLLPFSAFAHAGYGKHPHFAFASGPVQHVLHRRHVIYRWLSVGHTAHGGKAATSSGKRAGGDSLFVLLARFPQMTVDVYETRRKHQPRSIKHSFRTGGIAIFVHTDCCDAAVLDQDAPLGIQALRGVQYPCAAYQQARHRFLSNSPAWRAGRGGPSGQPHRWTPAPL